ncbi:EpsG family protein [Pantoea sp. BAV 3049]|uniref:EpsG family protein n=1 Tax=Pantoea sp. BAV 3049 TaxID=2654188 RepID=UPI00131CE60F|nr:EpsG family protein [Pantoea sp. BAV 3049]
MEMYWIISLSLCALGILEVFLAKREKTRWLRMYIYFIVVCVVFIFGGIRDVHSGVDDYQYRRFFQEFNAKITILGLASAMDQFRYEPAIYLISCLVRIFTTNADVFIFFYCMISVCVNAHYFRKLSPLPIVALAVYSAHLFINKDLNQIRFGLSSAFFLGFVYHLSIRNKAGSAGLLFLSFISHATAIVALLIPAALIIKKNKYIPAAIVLVCIPLAMMGSQSVIAFISSHLGSLGERAMGYADRDSAQEQGIFTLSNLKNILFVFIYSALLLNDKIKNSAPEKFAFFYLLVLTFAIGSGLRMALQDYASGGRLANYILQVEPVLLSICVFECRRILRVIAVTITVLMLLYYLYYNTVARKQSVTGYHVSGTFMLIHPV